MQVARPRIPGNCMSRRVGESNCSRNLVKPARCSTSQEHSNVSETSPLPRRRRLQKRSSKALAEAPSKSAARPFGRISGRDIDRAISEAELLTSDWPDQESTGTLKSSSGTEPLLEKNARDDLSSSSASSGYATESSPSLRPARDSCHGVLSPDPWQEPAAIPAESTPCSHCSALLTRIQVGLTSLRRSRPGQNPFPRARDRALSSASSSPRGGSMPALLSAVPGNSQPVATSSKSQRIPDQVAELRQLRAGNQKGRASAEGKCRTDGSPASSAEEAVEGDLASLASRQPLSLAEAERLSMVLWSKQCCQEQLLEQTWEDLLEQLIKARRIRAAVRWLERGQRQGRGITKKTYERLVFAACAKGRVAPGSILWQIWTMRTCVGGGAFPLPKAACCALIRGLGRAGEPNHAELVFKSLREENGWHPPVIRRLKHLTENVAAGAPWPDHNPQCKEFGSRSEPPQLAAARNLLPAGRSQPEVMAFNSIMEAFARSGDVGRVEDYFCEMVDVWGLRPNKYSFAALIQAHCKAGDIVRTTEVWSLMESFRVGADAHMYSLVMDLIVKKGSLEAVNSLREDMSTKKVKLDGAILCSLLQAGSKRGDLRTGLEDMKLAVRSGLEMDAHLACTAIHVLGRRRKLDDARSVFMECPEKVLATSKAVWTAMIGALLRGGDPAGALQTLQSMEDAGLSPNVRTFNCLISGLKTRYGSLTALIFAQSVLRTNRPWLHSNVATSSMLVNMYIQNLLLNDAQQVLQDMKISSVRANDVLIRGIQKSFAHLRAENQGNAISALVDHHGL